MKHIQMENMKIYSIALQNAKQTTVSSHLASTRMAIIKQNTENRCWQGRGEIVALALRQWE